MLLSNDHSHILCALNLKPHKWTNKSSTISNNKSDLENDERKFIKQ